MKINKSSNGFRLNSVILKKDIVLFCSRSKVVTPVDIRLDYTHNPRVGEVAHIAGSSRCCYI
jgi:hypothetical protein